MKNFINDGNAVVVTAPYTVTAGQGVQVGTNLFGVAATDATNGTTVVIHRVGRYSVTKLSTDVVTAGAPLYWDNGNRRLTITPSTHKLVGIAAAAAGNGVAEADVLLTGQA